MIMGKWVEGVFDKQLKNLPPPEVCLHDIFHLLICLPVCFLETKSCCCCQEDGDACPCPCPSSSPSTGHHYFLPLFRGLPLLSLLPDILNLKPSAILSARFILHLQRICLMPMHPRNIGRLRKTKRVKDDGTIEQLKYCGKIYRNCIEIALQCCSSFLWACW